MKETQNEQELTQKVLTALISEPTTYHIEVLQNSCLPVSLKGKKELTFVIKAPVIDTLARAGKIAVELPEDIFEAKKNTVNFLAHLDKMAEILSILIHGDSRKPRPDWYEQFFMDNLQPNELLQIMQETMVKCKTDFFLPCFQIANQMNPMTLRKFPKKEKTD